jgi:hypothetical protein
VELWRLGCLKDEQSWLPQGSALLGEQQWREIVALFLSDRDRAGTLEGLESNAQDSEV